MAHGLRARALLFVTHGAAAAFRPGRRRYYASSGNAVSGAATAAIPSRRRKRHARSAAGEGGGLRKRRREGRNCRLRSDEHPRALYRSRARARCENFLRAARERHDYCDAYAHRSEHPAAFLPKCIGRAEESGDRVSDAAATADRRKRAARGAEFNGGPVTRGDWRGAWGRVQSPVSDEGWHGGVESAQGTG